MTIRSGLEAVRFVSPGGADTASRRRVSLHVTEMGEGQPVVCSAANTTLRMKAFFKFAASQSAMVDGRYPIKWTPWNRNFIDHVQIDLPETPLSPSR